MGSEDRMMQRRKLISMGMVHATQSLGMSRDQWSQLVIEFQIVTPPMTVCQ
jgi:hypothetical protein